LSAGGEVRDVNEATLSTIRVYPVKALDGLTVEAATLGRDGGLGPDRVVALVDADGDYVNGKNERAIHRVSARYDAAAGTVRLTPPAVEAAPTESVPAPATFRVPGLGDADADETADGETGIDDADGEVTADDTDDGATSYDTDGETGIDDAAVAGGPDALASWVGDYLGYEVRAAVTEPSYPDDTAASGPTLLSRATLSTVGDWFDLSERAVARRFRPNLVVSGVPAFWEDRLYGDRSEHVRVRVGDATLDGVGPCRRCVVPARDPDTGAETEGFRERFLRRRTETLPEWSDGPRFEGAFRLAVNTVVPPAGRETTLAVGDPVTVDGSVPADAE